MAELTPEKVEEIVAVHRRADERGNREWFGPQGCMCKVCKRARANFLPLDKISAFDEVIGALKRELGHVHYSTVFEVEFESGGKVWSISASDIKFVRGGKL